MDIAKLNSLTQLELQQLLWNQVALGLPGEAAHKIILPERPNVSPQNAFDRKNEKLAAVLVVFQKINSEWCIVLIKRPEYEGTHSGQMAFPGGQTEKEDNNFLDTALRECEEEVGANFYHLSKESITLTPIFIPPSGYIVHPFIVVNEKNITYTPDPTEVAEIKTFPVSSLIDVNAIKKVKMKHRDMAFQTNAFLLDKEIIWGATACMLSEVRELFLK